MVQKIIDKWRKRKEENLREKKERLERAKEIAKWIEDTFDNYGKDIEIERPDLERTAISIFADSMTITRYCEEDVMEVVANILRKKKVYKVKFKLGWYPEDFTTLEIVKK